ncbi:MAG: hypothetical protein AB7H86_03210 [Blastocatellales bacterium]
MSRRVITFAFRSEVPVTRQEQLLAEIADWEHIEQAEPLKPDSTVEALRRMCFAYIDDSADAHSLIAQLAEIPEIESASCPTPRRLV